MDERQASAVEEGPASTVEEGPASTVEPSRCIFGCTGGDSGDVIERDGLTVCRPCLRRYGDGGPGVDVWERARAQAEQLAKVKPRASQ